MDDTVPLLDGEHKMTYVIASGAYLLFSLAFGMLVGKCIAYGMGSDLERS